MIATVRAKKKKNSITPNDVSLSASSHQNTDDASQGDSLGSLLKELAALTQRVKRALEANDSAGTVVQEPTNIVEDNPFATGTMLENEMRAGTVVQGPTNIDDDQPFAPATMLENEMQIGISDAERSSTPPIPNPAVEIAAKGPGIGNQHRQRQTEKPLFSPRKSRRAGKDHDLRDHRDEKGTRDKTRGRDDGDRRTREERCQEKRKHSLHEKDRGENRSLRKRR